MRFPRMTSPALLPAALLLAATAAPAWGLGVNRLGNGSFETALPIGAGHPTATGSWSGDQSSIVAAESGVAPVEGARMLRFVGSGPTTPNGIACEVFQLVDLTPIASLVAAGGLSAVASMQVNRVAGDAQTDSRFRVRLRAHQGSPATFTPGTALVLQDGERFSDALPATWETVEAEIAIPTDATYLSIEIQALENVFDDPVAPEFDGHYADAVSVRIEGLEAPGTHAEPTAEIVWTGTTGDGVLGGPHIEAEVGDVLRASIYLTAGEAGLQSYDISLRFDEDLADELQLVSADGLLTGLTQAVGGNPASTQESTPGQHGLVLGFAAQSLPSGPSGTRFEIGRVDFHVIAPLTDGPDVVSGLFDGAAAAAVSNAGAPLPVRFGKASVNAAVGASIAVDPIEAVWIREPGNPPDTGGEGSVPYVYRIGRWEVSVDEYVAFLNAVDPDGTNALGLFSSSMQSNARGGVTFDSNGLPGQKYAAKSAPSGKWPINFVSWPDAARYVNWLENGRPAGGGGTEDGTYDLSAPSPIREPGTGFALPTVDEWYKAAYYVQFGGGSYHQYPNHFGTPVAALCDAAGAVTNQFSRPANHASGCDFAGLNGHLTRTDDSGTYQASFTSDPIDMGGNVWEIQELLGGTSTARGGAFDSPLSTLASSSPLAPMFEGAGLGFRIVLTAEADSDGGEPCPCESQTHYY